MLPSPMGPFQEALEFYQPLIEGDERACRELMHRLHAEENMPVVDICAALTEAFHRIGQAWECAGLAVYREHIASQIAYQILLDLRRLLRVPEDQGPVAIGCAPEHDPYLLPTLMVELVLRDLGWRAQSFGTNLPLEMLAAAIDDIQPRLCWISISHAESEQRLREQLAVVQDAGRRRNARIICGGRAVSDSLRQACHGVTFLSDLKELDEQVHRRRL